MLLSCPFLGSDNSSQKEFCIKEKCQFFDRINKVCFIATIGEASLKYLMSSKTLSQEKELENEKILVKGMDINEKEEKYSIYLTKAYKLFRNHLYIDAELEIKRALIYKNDGFDARRLLGRIFLEQGKHDEAIIAYRDSIKIQHEAQLYRDMISQYVELYKDFPDREKFYKNIVEKFMAEADDGKSKLTYFALACCYYYFEFSDISEKARLELAFSNLNKTIKGKDKIIDSYFLIFDLNQKQEFFTGDEIIDYMKKAIKLDEENPYSYLYYSKALSLYGDERDTDKIMINIKKAVELAHDDTKVLYEYGKILQKYLYFPKAIEYYKKALEISPDSIQVLESLARVYKISNLYEKSLAIYENLISCFPYSEKYLSSLADIYQYKLKFEDACENYLKLIEVNPNNSFYYKQYYTLKNKLIDTNEKKSVIAELKKETELETYNHLKLVHYVYALKYLAENPVEEPTYSLIVDNLKKIIRIEPSFMGAYWELAYMYLDKGEDNKKVKELIDQLLELDEKNDTQLYFHI
ncbi:MAG: hypothetical protein C0601_12385 [Candidatus Muiribacterium halophilum]|uniref:Tetratricopeptide repeat protein n=1 Tax=Muiribacterium halophilum TaxID=2053465 RepID=A0A2N5ZAS4_MUIH1|nr:MAG: hypothetical protein C0601_12385 [Candidatus Muirbacterium halophilum]